MLAGNSFMPVNSFEQAAGQDKSHHLNGLDVQFI